MAKRNECPLQDSCPIEVSYIEVRTMVKSDSNILFSDKHSAFQKPVLVNSVHTERYFAVICQ